MFIRTTFRSPLGAITARPLHALRAFSISALVAARPKPLPPRSQLDDADLVENFLKGSGPGGQKINKTSCAVQLKHLPTGLVVKCQSTRSQSQNRKVARRILADKVEFLEKGPESRLAKKAERRSVKAASRYKKSMRKYRKLGEEEDDGDEDEGVDAVDTEEVGQEKGKGGSGGEKGEKGPESKLAKKLAKKVKRISKKRADRNEKAMTNYRELGEEEDDGDEEEGVEVVDTGEGGQEKGKGGSGGEKGEKGPESKLAKRRSKKRPIDTRKSRDTRRQ